MCSTPVKIREFLSPDYVSLFCEKNSDGTRKLRLKGKDLFQRMGRRLTSDDIPVIIEYMKMVGTVISLDLCYNDIHDEGVKILVDDYLNEENQLEHLNLMHCDLTGQSVIHINHSKFNHLKSLRINGNKLCPQTATAISRLLDTCMNLEYLDIGETDLTSESITTICHFVEYSNLKILDISRVVPKSCIYVINTKVLAQDIGYMLDKNKSLLELHIEKCNFLGHDVHGLLYGLETHPLLVMLDLSCNNIGNYGVELLAQWLKSKPPLRALNISNNQFGEIGARALSQALPFSSVRLLDVSYNQIPENGLNHILYTLKNPDKLIMLFIWGNKFGPKSSAIFQRLLQNKILHQENTDAKAYEVDGVWYVAHYPSNHYKHRYYCVMDHGCPVELKIKKNLIPGEYARPRKILDLVHYGRFPPVNLELGVHPPKTEDDYCDSRCLDIKEN